VPPSLPTALKEVAKGYSYLCPEASAHLLLGLQPHLSSAHPILAEHLPPPHTHLVPGLLLLSGLGGLEAQEVGVASVSGTCAADEALVLFSVK
jgi:hypothetical protein